MFARNPWNTAFGSRVAFADLAGRQTQWTGDRREFLGRHGSLAGPRALHACATVEARRRGPRSVLCPARRRWISSRAKPRKSCSFSARAASAGEAQTLLARYRSTDLDAVLRRGRALERRARHRSGEDTGSVHGHHAQSLDALSDTGLSHVGALRFLSGERCIRISRSTAGWHGAGSFRDRRSRASTCCAPPGDSSARATFSIGGCRRRARVFARASADDRIWLAYAAAHYIDRHRRRRDPRRKRAVPRRPRVAARRARCVLPTCDLARTAPLLRTLRARARCQPRTRRARPAADRHRRLERRHESRRRAGPGRKRLARLVPARHAGGFRAAWQARATNSARLRNGWRTPPRCASRSSAKHGMGHGIGAAISTMAHPSDRRRARNAASIRSRNHGA